MYKIDGMVAGWEKKVLRIKSQQKDLNIIAKGLIVIALLNYMVHSASFVIEGSIEFIKCFWLTCLLLVIAFSYIFMLNCGREIIDKKYFSGGITLVLVNLFAIGIAIFLFFNFTHFVEKAVEFFHVFILYQGIVFLVKASLCCKKIILRKLIDYTRLVSGLYIPPADSNDKADTDIPD